MAQFNRPDHPDFLMLSEVVIAQDNAMDGATIPFEEFVGQTIDIGSLSYMAEQRAMRVTGPYVTRQETAKVAAVYMDAFMAGAAFQAKKNGQVSE